MASRLVNSSMRNEEWGIWKQGISHVENRQEKQENARPKSSILEAFGRGNDRKFKTIFSYSAKSTLKWFWEAKFGLFSQKLWDENAIEFKIWQI